MATTIALHDDTKRLLKGLAAESGQTYDQCIQELIRTREKIPRSLFGKHPDLAAWGE